MGSRIQLEPTQQECREEMKYKLEMYMPKNKGNDIEYNGKVKGPTFSRNALATDASESILRTDTITNQDRIWAEENKKMLSNLTFGEQCKRFFWKFNDYGMWWPEKPIIAADATNSEHFSHYYEYGKKKP